MDDEELASAASLAKQKLYDEAEAKYSDIINKLQSSGKMKELALAYNGRGQVYYKKIEFPLAIEDYTKAISCNKTLAAAYYNRGTVHYRLGDCKEAVRDMEVATILERTNVEFQEGLKESKRLLERSNDL